MQRIYFVLNLVTNIISCIIINQLRSRFDIRDVKDRTRNYSMARTEFKAE